MLCLAAFDCRMVTGQCETVSTARCSEIGSLVSLDACKSGASSDVREPISLHLAVLTELRTAIGPVCSLDPDINSLLLALFCDNDKIGSPCFNCGKVSCCTQNFNSITDHASLYKVRSHDMGPFQVWSSSMATQSQLLVGNRTPLLPPTT